jgi:predicted transcriptional regulator
MVTPQQELDREQNELERLLREREEIEVKIAKTKRRLAAWAELCDDTEAGEQVVELDLGGLTEACRTALRSSRRAWINVTEVKDILEGLGFPIKDYKAPIASLTTTLNRLSESGEVVSAKIGNTTDYRWVGPWGFSADHPLTKARLADLRKQAVSYERTYESGKGIADRQRDSERKK